MYWAVSILYLGILAGTFLLLLILFHLLFAVFGDCRLYRVKQLVFVLDTLCNKFSWLCENTSILIDQLMYGGCKRFTSIIRNLSKLSNLQL